MTTTTTGPSVRDVDAAVRSVLADLVSASRANRPGVSGTESVFHGRLLSLRQVETLPERARKVWIAPGTVVTPLAADVLKRRGIAVVWISRSEVARAGAVGEWGFTIETESGVVEVFRRALLDRGEDWREVGPSLDGAARWVAQVQGRGAVVLTDEASVAVYRGCQVPGVRAATAEEPGAVARAVRALGVNLLVIEPAGKSISLLNQIGATFRRAGAPTAPGRVGVVSGGFAS